MTTRLTLFFSILLLLASCDKNDDLSREGLQSLDEVGHEQAAELLRLNVNKEYGGALLLHELFHGLVFDEGLPCDTVVAQNWEASVPNRYSFSLPVTINTDCRTHFQRYNDRIYRTKHNDNSSLSATSETFTIEGYSTDDQTIAGNTEDQRYIYSHSAIRFLDITKGMNQELRPDALVSVSFPLCKYDIENVEITEVTIAPFTVEVTALDKESNRRKTVSFQGDLHKIEGNWTAIFEDGTTITL